MDRKKKGAIRFTIERQRDNKLPFLNVLVENVNGVLEVDIYRKPTSTLRGIQNDSFHDIRHKMAAYHSMAHFMTSLPLTPNKIEKETEKILEIGAANGYGPRMILPIIMKHQHKKSLSQFSTFFEISLRDEPVKRISVRFFPDVTKKLMKTYSAHGLEIVHRNENSIRHLLGSIKDIPLKLHRSGIYSVQCSCCGRTYYGMTVRKIYERFNEHVKSAAWKTKTSVGAHMSSTNHTVDISGLDLVQCVQKAWKMEFYEAIHIYKNIHLNLLNSDNGNIKSKLLEGDIIDLTDDTHEHSFDEFFDCID